MPNPIPAGEFIRPTRFELLEFGCAEIESPPECEHQEAIKFSREQNDPTTIEITRYVSRVLFMRSAAWLLLEVCTRPQACQHIE